MIGQRNNLKFIDACVSKNNLPRFIIIRGAKGSGKKELIKYIVQQTGYEHVNFLPSVDSVRNLISLSYQQVNPIIYSIYDCERLSANAENSLLKITEEPPRNAYIILTTNDDSLLPTIKSRGTLIVMEDYSYEEKKSFAQNNLHIKSDVEEKVNIADTIGDLISLASIDFNQLSTYCDNVVKYIHAANIGSALKIGKKVAVKESDDSNLFDLSLFLGVLLYKYTIKCMESRGNYQDFLYYYRCKECVFAAKKQLTKTYNKQYIVDEMILKLREIA